MRLFIDYLKCRNSVLQAIMDKNRVQMLLMWEKGITNESRMGIANESNRYY